MLLLFLSCECEGGGYEVMIKRFLLRLVEVVSAGELMEGVGWEYECRFCFLVSLLLSI